MDKIRRNDPCPCGSGKKYKKCYPGYFEKSIKYCKEFCSCFPNENELIIHNMRRSIVDSNIYLKKIDEAERELDRLISDYPGNPWSYIAYGDMYQFGINIIKDPIKAKEFYERALLVAKDKTDKQAIEERLEDIKNEDPVKNENNKLVEE